MDWAILRPAFVSLFSSLAAEDMRQPLPEGHVSWFGTQVPFIDADTPVGIYLRVSSHDKRGRPGRRYQNVTESGRAKTQAVRTRQEKVTLQIQAKSLENNDTNDAQVWIDRITDNIYDDTVHSYLKSLGFSVIEVRPTIETTVKSDLDGTVGWDNRYISSVSVDIVFQAVNQVLGIPVDYIEHVRASGTVTGAVSGTLVVPEFEAL